MPRRAPQSRTSRAADGSRPSGRGKPRTSAGTGAASRVVGRTAWGLALLGVAVAGAGGWVWWSWGRASDPTTLRARAESATEARDWEAARLAWRRFNATPRASGRSLLAEARACFATHRAAEAERALLRSIALDPTDVEPWRLELELLRVEGRVAEAIEAGARAWGSVVATGRRDLLRAWTLAALAEPPADRARASLERWSATDPDDLDALSAYLNRVAADPREGDPDRTSRIARLDRVLRARPEHSGIRDALINALADAGEPDRGRALLDAWPTPGKGSADYRRLRGRWDLDYDRRPDQAAEAFREALKAWPHDWKTQYRLARALKALGQSDASRRAADTVAHLRELLDPARLGPRLTADLEKLSDPAALRDLSALCRDLGLTPLADAWHAESLRAGG